MRLGLVGGTGFERLVRARTAVDVETPWGDVAMLRARWGGDDVVFVPRHGVAHETGARPDRFRAVVQAMADAKPDWVVGLCNVGSLRADLPTGSWVVASDFVEHGDPSRATFHEGQPVHVDFSEPYCPALRAGLGSVADAAGTPAREGVYASVRGPRLETPAEVRALARDADVVGMTGGPEAALARERGLCYAALCLVSNLGAGLQPSLDAKAIAAAARARAPDALRILRGLPARLPAAKTCSCAAVPQRARW